MLESRVNEENSNEMQVRPNQLIGLWWGHSTMQVRYKLCCSWWKSHTRHGLLARSVRRHSCSSWRHPGKGTKANLWQWQHQKVSKMAALFAALLHFNVGAYGSRTSIISVIDISSSYWLENESTNQRDMKRIYVWLCNIHKTLLQQDDKKKRSISFLSQASGWS